MLYRSTVRGVNITGELQSKVLNVQHRCIYVQPLENTQLHREMPQKFHLEGVMFTP